VTDPAELARRAQPIVTFAADRYLTVGQLEDAIQAQNPLMQERYASERAVRAVLDKNLRFELLADEAERRGYGQNAAVVMAARQNAVQALLKREFDDTIQAEAVPEADMHKYYDEHRDEFVRGEGRRASLLLLPDDAAARAQLARAQSADLRAFRELVRSSSIDQASKQRGGDLSTFDAQGRFFDDESGSIDPAIARAVFALRELGATSDIVAVGDHRAILRLSGIQPARDEPFAEAKERIRMRLWRERRQSAIDAHLDTLKKQLNVRVHPELVDAVKLDAGPPTPPNDGLPSGFPHIAPQGPHDSRHTDEQPR
jgi:peptidyl-prolyl cis-trans isomerase C